MKKHGFTFLPLIVVLVLLCGALPAKAQFEPGSCVLSGSAGAGILSHVGNGKALPLITPGFEFGVVKLGPDVAGIFGAGLTFGYQKASDYYYTTPPNSYKVEYPWEGLYVNIRGAWHPDLTQYMNRKVFDLYFAVDIGYLFVNQDFNTYTSYNGYNGPRLANEDNSTGRIGIAVGGRVYLNDALGAFAELGYDEAIIKGGVLVKLDSLWQ